MAYINFKEECYKLNNQFEKRKKNNQEIYDKIIKNRKLVKEYDVCKEYSFKKIDKKLIGKEGLFREDDFTEIKGLDIICSTFCNCRFENVKIKDCSFIGCTFDMCKFKNGGVIFDNCVFIKDISVEIPSLNVKDNFSSCFTNCNLYIKFKNCNLSYCTFEKSIFKESSFENSDMSGVILYKCELYKTEVCDCNMQSFKTYRCYLEDFEFNDTYMTIFDEKTFFDKLILKDKSKESYEGSYMIYQNLADKFKNNTLDDNFGEYYYLSKKEQHKTLDFFPKIGSYIYWFICGYGERPLYSIYFSLFIMFAFSVLYLVFGLKIDEQIVTYRSIASITSEPFSELFRNFLESFSISVGMFAGVGIMESTPTPSSYILSDLEMIIGILTVGVGVGALVRKVIR